MLNTAIENVVGDKGFAEGTFNFGEQVWFCCEHSTKVKIGKECGFCVFDEIGEVAFDKWASALTE